MNINHKVKHHDTPESLVLFVTGRCNARCRHCFYSDQLNNDDDEIDVEVLEKIVTSLNVKTSLSLTGGEPFALKNLLDYVEIALNNENIASLSIPTNGFFVDQIKHVVSTVCSRYEKPLRIQLSLDGLAATNDNLRGLPGGYHKVIEAAHWLEGMAKEHSQLSYVVATTVMKSNLAEIPELIGILKQEDLKHKITFVRGNSFSTFGVPKDILRADYDSTELLPELSELEALASDISAQYPDFFDTYGLRKLTTTISTLKNRSRTGLCFAGSKDGVVFHDGSISLCEQVIPFGQLAQWGWNLYDAWNSSQANEYRDRLKKCSCIHGCNISTAATSSKLGG